MHVSQAVKARVEAKLKQCIAIAEKHYNTTIKYPRVTYDLRGQTAGKANYGNWHVMFNPILLNENLDTFIGRTVPHEMAHLITDQVYPEAHEAGFKMVGYGAIRRKKRSPHGSQWQSVMRVLGVVDIGRCHSYDTTRAAVRKVKKYEYICSGCQKSIMVGPKIHARLVRKPDASYHNGCRGHLLKLKGAAASKPLNIPLKPAFQPKPAAVPPNVAAFAGSGSKIDRAKALYANNSHLDRSGLIKLFIAHLQMTPAGASTYAYNVMKG